VKDEVYPYDAQLYDRSYLNCYQRQGIVMLAERVPDLHLFFYQCLVNSDSMLDHVVREQRPKFAYKDDAFWDDEALARIGVTRRYLPFDTYAQARQTLLDTVAEVGYAIPHIDVFYLPHTTEFYNRHLLHTITLTGYDPDSGQWSLLDDNRASVLCRYAYPEDVIAAAFDNGVLRHVSWFPTGEYKAEEAGQGAAKAFAGHLENYSDSYALLTGIGEIVSSPWFSAKRVMTLLYDAFSVYDGSRACFGEFIGRQPGYADAAPMVAGIVRQCKAIRNQLMIGKATGRVDAPRLQAACLDLKSAEEALIGRLRQP
jgi:hypothetical protein